MLHKGMVGFSEERITESEMKGGSDNYTPSQLMKAMKNAACG